MIEIQAHILRGSCTPVFFVGETIECKINFKHVVTNKIKVTNKINQEVEQEIKINKKESILSQNTLIDNKKHDEKNETMFSMFLSRPKTEKNFLKQPNSSSSSKSFQSFINDDNSISSQDTLSFDLESIPIIAWSCAQIDCNCYIDESRVMLPKDPLRYGINNDIKKSDVSSTSFQPNKDRVGISVYSSKPKIIFCNLVIKPGESKSCKQLSNICCYFYAVNPLI
jgi:hypothetical protein